MNAGWVDTMGKDFYLYRDGNTLSISRGIKAIFEEVSKVAAAVGVPMLEYPEEDFWKKSSIMSTYFRAAFDKEGTVAKISGPYSVKSRYITEDLPYGLVPIKKLGQQFNVATPVIDAVIEFASVINQTDYMKEDAVIEFASVINQTDYMKEGMSLEEMGIAGLGRDKLEEVLEQGFS